MRGLGLQLTGPSSAEFVLQVDFALAPDLALEMGCISMSLYRAFHPLAFQPKSLAFAVAWPFKGCRVGCELDKVFVIMIWAPRL